MKITIEFNLPDEQDQHMIYVNAPAMQAALQNFDRYIRNKTKHAPDSMSDETLRALQGVRNEFNAMTEGLIYG